MHTTRLSSHYQRQHHHIFQFTLLFLLIATGFFSFVKCFGDSMKQVQIVTLTGVAYAFWGIFHHYYERNLNWKIVIEYCSIALLGISILWALIFLVH
jgi:uncharacterized membrane protein YfcA